MSGDTRLEELRRRIQKDPGSIVFAQLAEELRRTGRYQESVDVCRAGLAVHPNYLSARVTLGRALIDLNFIDEARRELEQVRRTAPDNLSALRALAEIHGRGGSVSHAEETYSHAPVPEPAVPEPAVLVVEAPIPPPILIEPPIAQTPPLVEPPIQPALVVAVGEAAQTVPDPVVRLNARPAVHDPEAAARARTMGVLEQWLAAIHVARAHRSA